MGRAERRLPRLRRQGYLHWHVILSIRFLSELGVRCRPNDTRRAAGSSKLVTVRFLDLEFGPALHQSTQPSKGGVLRRGPDTCASDGTNRPPCHYFSPSIPVMPADGLNLHMSWNSGRALPQWFSMKSAWPGLAASCICSPTVNVDDAIDWTSTPSRSKHLSVTRKPELVQKLLIA